MRWFLEKINKIVKFVDKFTKINTKRHKLVKLEMIWERNTRTDTNEIQKKK